MEEGRKIDVYQVDSSVPIPVRVLPPLDKLEVGESIAFPVAMQKSVSTKASLLKKQSGKSFKVAKVDEEIARVWRTN